MNTGLKRGTVRLMPHQKEWEESARESIRELKQLLGDTAVDIQHIGSTAVWSVCAKPVIDLVIGVRRLEELLPHIEALKEQGFIYRGEDVAGQRLLVAGDFEKDMRTHHIHVVRWGGAEWNNYINFRDYLNAHPEKAMRYDACKQKLAARFPDDRKSYTAGKQELIGELLKEAAEWRAGRANG